MVQLDKFQGHDNEFYYFTEVFTTCECGASDDWSMFDCHVLINSETSEIKIDDEREDDDFEQFDLQIFICECGRWGTYMR